MHRHEPQVFIYGSCVSRDTFEFLQGVTLRGYVARCSLISAMSNAIETPVTDWRGSSPFQRQQVERDAGSELIPLLKAQSDDIDLLLWDLTDERLGVYVSSDYASVVTNSVDLMKTTHIADDPTRFTHLTLKSPRHLELFKLALDRWRLFLDAQALSSKLILIAPPWASTTASGAPTPSSFGTSAEQAQDLFAPYIDMIQEALDPTVITVEAQHRGADSHRWGQAPFHYEDAVYQEIADLLTIEIDSETNRNAQAVRDIN